MYCRMRVMRVRVRGSPHPTRLYTRNLLSWVLQGKIGLTCVHAKEVSREGGGDVLQD